MLEVFPWQQPQWQQLIAAADRGMLPHALLLSGQEGTGLGHFAACLGARFLCMQPPEGKVSCNECKPCILFEAGNHPDFLFIQPEEKGKQIRIDRIREMIDFICLSTQFGRYKVVVIDPADAMNRNAANTLLKTLEEPPPESLILLVSHRTSLIPVTVRSRCQKIKINAQGQQVLDWLHTRQIKTQGDLQGLLALTDSGPLSILELFESGRESVPHQLLEDLGEIHARHVDPVHMAEKWQALGAADVLHWLLLCFGRIARLKLTPAGVKPDKSSIIGYLQYLANDLDLHQAVACYDQALRNYHAATGPIALSKQGLLEDMIVFMQTVKERG